MEKLTIDEQALALYEKLGIENAAFLTPEQIGALHQEQMIYMYNSFQNTIKN